MGWVRTLQMQKANGLSNLYALRPWIRWQLQDLKQAKISLKSKVCKPSTKEALKSCKTLMDFLKLYVLRDIDYTRPSRD